MNTQFCSKCGKQLKQYEKFCSRCGSKVMSAQENIPVQNKKTEGSTVKGKITMILGILLSGLGGFISLVAYAEKSGEHYTRAQAAAFIGSSSGSRYLEEVSTYFTIGMGILIIGILLFLFGLMQYITSK